MLHLIFNLYLWFILTSFILFNNLLEPIQKIFKVLIGFHFLLLCAYLGFSAWYIFMYQVHPADVFTSSLLRNIAPSIMSLVLYFKFKSMSPDQKTIFREKMKNSFFENIRLPWTAHITLRVLHGAFFGFFLFSLTFIVQTDYNWEENLISGSDIILKVLYYSYWFYLLNINREFKNFFFESKNES